jgi:hypothetical protein
MNKRREREGGIDREECAGQICQKKSSKKKMSLKTKHSCHDKGESKEPTKHWHPPSTIRICYQNFEK